MLLSCPLLSSNGSNWGLLLLCHLQVRARDRFRRLGEYVKITVWLRMLTANTNYPIVKLCRTNKRSLNWTKKAPNLSDTFWGIFVDLSLNGQTPFKYWVGRPLVPKVSWHVFWKFPFLAWSVWQLQYSPTAWELSENISQNLRNKWPPHPVQIIWLLKCVVLTDGP